MRRAVAGVSAGLVLTAGCSFWPENQTSPNDSKNQEAFTTVQNYWIQQGLGEAASTQLVTLREPDDRFFCTLSEPDDKKEVSRTIKSTEPYTLAAYCRGNNTVVAVEPNLHAAMAKSSPPLNNNTFRLMVMAHEMGHRVPDVRNEESEHDRKKNELQAECYMGAAVASIDPSGLPDILKLAATFPDIGTHGTGKQRAEAIQAGANDRTDEVCSTYVAPQ